MGIIRIHHLINHSMRVAAVAGLMIVLGTSFIEAQNSLYHGSLSSWLQRLNPRAARIMPLGSTITAGQEGGSSYRERLFKRFVSLGYGERFNVVGTLTGVAGGQPPANPLFDQDHLGLYGASSLAIRGAVGSALRTLGPSGAPDIVLLECGGVDLVSGVSDADIEANISAIIDTLRTANSKVVVLMATVPVAGGGSYNASQAIAVNDRLSSLSILKGTNPSPIWLVDLGAVVTEAMIVPGASPALNSTGDSAVAAAWFFPMRLLLDRMEGRPLEITPRSGRYAQTAGFDAIIIQRSLLWATSSTITLDGIAVPSEKIISGTIESADWTAYARTYRLKNIVTSNSLTPGVHRLAVHAVMNDGSVQGDTVSWNIVPVTEQ